MTTPIPPYQLDAHHAADLAHLLGVVEDFLLHSEQAQDDLADFAFHHCPSPARAVAATIDDLGRTAVSLGRHLRAHTPIEGDTRA